MNLLSYFIEPYRDKFYVFLCGFVPTSIKSYLVIEKYTPFVDFMFKIVSTVVLGFFGGLAGIGAKVFVKWIKKLYKKEEK